MGGIPLATRLSQCFFCLIDTRWCFRSWEKMIAFIMPRRVPASGRVLDGHLIPENSTVGVHLYHAGRDKQCFGENADDFYPERWQEDKRLKDGEFLNMMVSAYPLSRTSVLADKDFRPNLVQHRTPRMYWEAHCYVDDVEITCGNHSSFWSECSVSWYKRLASVGNLCSYGGGVRLWSQEERRGYLIHGLFILSFLHIKGTSDESDGDQKSTLYVLGAFKIGNVLQSDPDSDVLRASLNRTKQVLSWGSTY